MYPLEFSCQAGQLIFSCERFLNEEGAISFYVKATNHDWNKPFFMGLRQDRWTMLNKHLIPESILACEQALSDAIFAQKRDKTLT